MNQARASFVASWQEWKVLEARIANRDASLVAALEQEIARLRAEVERAEQRLFPELARDGLAFDAPTERARTEILRSQALETLKHLKVDPDLWQSLASS